MNDLPNRAMSDYWSGACGRHWVGSQAAYDAELAGFADDVLGAAAIEPGVRVLDVGCGTGAMTVLAAAAASRAVVTGVDISPTMLEGANTRAASAGVTNVRFLLGDVQTLDLEWEWFDVVISRFGVMFFEDPTAAFANLGSVTRSGGRLAFVCWQGPSLNPWMTAPSESIAPFVEQPPAADPSAPGPFAFADPERVRAILGDSGWIDTRIVDQQRPIHLAGTGSADDAVDCWISRPNIAEPLQAGPPELTEQVRAAMRADFERRHDGTGVRFDSATWLVTARRP